MMQGDISWTVWGQNIAATVLGAVVVLATRRARGTVMVAAGATRVLVLALVAVLGATLWHRGMDGVHRWVAIGPMQLHAGALALPTLLVLLARRDRTISVVAALATLCILWRQPDAAQAGAFALAWSVAEGTARGRNAAWWAIAVAFLLAGATALRPDPLRPVAHVEGIVGMAGHAGTAWVVASLAALAFPAPTWWRTKDARTGRALASYIAATLCAAWLGDFPVPYLGYGISPILGYYLAVAAGTPTLHASSALSTGSPARARCSS